MTSSIRAVFFGGLIGIGLSFLSIVGNMKHVVSMGKPFQQVRLDMPVEDVIQIVTRSGAWCGDYHVLTCSFSDLNHFYQIQIDPATHRVIRKTVTRNTQFVDSRFLTGYRLLFS